ncbi:class I SAM-dependent methyltransferase [Fulvivirgaceae bacterium BMA10]|uniref:Class I SAM-dependent methyltransferase n=1 Tax=Splendidivirga corallicola TaxID=3051826 RepID=A0ABT8KJL1_9BACT|nr:class I SAM-dependent methyltransferase [Fulvivirgaceae bacterium BMA10]
MSTFENYFKSNQALWNLKTDVHVKSDFYDLEAFKKGKSSLHQIELDEIGDVKGKSMLHLQCHFGQDTLSWAREGAQVTGVDLSDKAIVLANKLNEELQLDAEFINANVYDLKDHLNKKFDIVFTSYGTIGWLPDLDKWADIVKHFLNENGIFYIIEFHPFIWMYDDDFKKITYSYFNQEVIHTVQEGTYADRDADIKHEEFSWNHSLSEVINALIRQGLKIESVNEFPFSCYNIFPNLIQDDQGYWRMKGLEDKLPLMYSIKASNKKSRSGKTAVS